MSHQLLQECVDHAGQPRSADEIAELVADSFSAGRCLVSELDQRNREFEYQKSEFFIDENDGDNNGPGSGLAQF